MPLATPYAPPPALHRPCKTDDPLFCPFQAPKLVMPPAPAAALPPLPRARLPYWMEIKAIGLGTNNTEDLWRLRTDRAGAAPREVLTMTDGSKFPPGGPTATRVVDSRSCPAMREVVADMRALLAGSPPIEPVVHQNEQTYYELEGEGPRGEAVSRRGMWGSSIERWMIRARERTRTCPPAPP